MWHYCWAHVVYHLMRWFPENNRLKIRIVITVFTVGLLFPEFYVLLTPTSSDRYCDNHLLDCMVATIIFSLFMIGFSFLFSIMDPVPWQVKLSFHVFGFLSFIFGMVLLLASTLSQTCRDYSPELYYFSLSMGIFSGLCILFFLLVVPFWLINIFRYNSVLDMPYRTGVCYEPVNCCSCIWHI